MGRLANIPSLVRDGGRGENAKSSLPCSRLATLSSRVQNATDENPTPRFWRRCELIQTPAEPCPSLYSPSPCWCSTCPWLKQRRPNYWLLQWPDRKEEHVRRLATRAPRPCHHLQSDWLPLSCPASLPHTSLLSSCFLRSVSQPTGVDEAGVNACIISSAFHVL